MAQRASIGTAASQQSIQQQAYPADNHLMPQSLRRIPAWYQDGPFRYNLRMWVGFLPGAVLVGAVAGKLSLVLAVAHIFSLAVVNVYCMAPLMWRSILNIPLFMLFHIFIALSGVWWWLQDEEFKKQDPRFTIFVERILFYLYPAVSVTMVTWVCGMLFGQAILPYAIGVAGAVALSLYVVPLQSSFAKPQTPTEMGLIQHWAIALVYIVLELCVPAVLYTALSFTVSVHGILSVGLLVVGPLFLLTLLEAQGLFYWMGLGPSPVQYIRWFSGALVLVQFTGMMYASRLPSHLSLLLTPSLFTLLGLTSAVEQAPPTSTPPLVLSLSLGLLYSTAFTFLPWAISHYFSFLSLPLSLVQLLLWGLAMATIVMVPLWKKMSTATGVWVLYNSVFILLEYILSWDGVYPSYVAMATTAAAALLFWRLSSVGHLPLNSSLLIICLHLTKLSLLLPYTPSPSTTLTPIAILLVSFMLLKLFVFESPSLSPSQLLVYSGLLLTGLLLAVDSLLSPLWTALTHKLPSTASLVATILVVVGVYVSHGISLLQERAVGKLSLLPPGLFTMAILLGLLQPEFNTMEMTDSMWVLLLAGNTLGERWNLTEEVVLAAWANMVVWLTLVAVLAVLGAIASNWDSRLTTLTGSFLGITLGFLAAIVLIHSPPLSPFGLLYAVTGSATITLVARAYTAKKNGSIYDMIIFATLLLSFTASFLTEWNTLPRMYLPGRTWLSFYALPCTQLLMASAAIIAVAFRTKMYHSRNQPYLPLIGNSCCLTVFLLAFLHPLHTQLEISIVLSSAILLLAQPDGLVFPKTGTIFLAPSMLSSVVALYTLALVRMAPKVVRWFSKAPSLFLAGRALELFCLLGSIPGQAIFLYYLWSGKQLKLPVLYLVLYILPNAMLPQFASSLASTLLGSIGVMSFCLLMLGDYSNIKIL